MSTTLHTEVLSLISNRENLIASIISLCAQMSVHPPTDADFASSTTVALECMEADHWNTLESIRDREMEDSWLDSRMEEGYDPYVGGYTDDC